MATTPPPPSPSALRMPAAPRHGPAYDEYEPYPTRASARLANQRVTRIEKTPPPSSPSVRSRAIASPKKQRKVEVEGLSPPRSTPGSPRKKARLGGHADTHPTTSHSLSHTSVQSRPSHLHPPTSRSTMAGDMLPTPIKTPSKKAVDDQSAARALFAPPMSTPKKSKKHTGFSLESFSEDLAPGQPAIQIYTDSRDRIPTMDPTEDNPFYAKPAMPNASEKQPTRTSKRRAAKRDPEVEGSLKRDDGIYCVFRGKKIFNRFSEEADNDDEDLGLLAARPDLMNTDTSDLLTSVQPLTRSSIKPRVLFPTASKDDESHHEDEATDVEENAKDDLSTPSPKSPLTTPASPGGTMRLRSGARFDKTQVDATPTMVSDLKKTEKKPSSPFARWQRKKQSPDDGTSTTPKKREAGPVSSSSGPAPKRTRGVRSA
ncbi:hypothetical protein N7474_009481 [Penicillium riverlandense]|uniref:uncharacterized protein n=1 Tax=Penicillium riverlandense TaxID=1903569 RepID=UPI002547797A|nr:uncharacterized protein N7474_009481 [Penicillium riverlandense]KAJ5808212.1 hypothetical protein N7474_009481 [Penicillium riverlandense]